MGKIQRVENTKSKQILEMFKQHEKIVEQVIMSGSIFKDDIKNLYYRLQRQNIDSALEVIDIEMINAEKSGIRVSLLKSAGITNISQVQKMSIERLKAINGIGEQMAKKIVENAAMIHDSMIKSVKVRIDPDNKDAQTTQLVNQCYYLLTQENNIERATNIQIDFYQSTKQDRKRVKSMTNLIIWAFMTTKKKEQCVNAYENLTEILESAYRIDINHVLTAYDHLNAVNLDLKKAKLQNGNRNSRMRTLSESEISSGAWEGFTNNPAPFYVLLESIVGCNIADTYNGLPEELVEKVNNFPIDLSLMKSNLREYQLFGAKYMLCQERVLIGDEMGLGKTVQAITAMSHMYANGRKYSLVVAPVSVLINWYREIPKHSQLTVSKIYGENREQDFNNWIKNGGIGITTYETISKLQIPDSFTLDMLVVDEAHYVKNPKAQRTIALKAFASNADHIIFMTGTPLENRVEEMCFLVECLRPDIASEIEGMIQISMAPEFREKLAPVYLRRTRNDVLTELPEKLEKEDWCIFEKEELDAYKNALLGGNFMAIRQVSWQIDDVSKSTKAKRLLEICENAYEEKRKVIVFSFFRDVIKKVETLLGDKCMEPITGDVSANRRQEIIDEFTAAHDGTVLIAQVQAGGTGLNIQTASVVVFCEPQLKPSIENQAISRVYRMGQARNVVVHRLLMDDSVDERITEILQNKTEIFDQFADESVIDETNKTLDEKKMMGNIVQVELERLGLS